MIRALLDGLILRRCRAIGTCRFISGDAGDCAMCAAFGPGGFIGLLLGLL